MSTIVRMVCGSIVLFWITLGNATSAEKPADLIIGKWSREAGFIGIVRPGKPTEKYVQIETVEFNKDGSLKLSVPAEPKAGVPEKTQLGRFRWLNDTEIELTLKTDEKETKHRGKVTVSKDELMIVGEKGSSKYKRTK